MWVGAAVIGWTAAKMIGGEPLLANWFTRQPWLRIALLYTVIIGGLVSIRCGAHQFARASARSVAAGDDRLGQRFGWLEDHMGMRRSVRARALGRDGSTSCAGSGGSALVIAIDRAFRVKATAIR
jgi:hypothetical protein